MQIRDYQAQHINSIVDAIEQYRTVLAQLPTGGGKTIEFSLIIKKYLHNHIDIEMGPTLILVHREELLYQAAKAVRSILGFEPCLITSNTSRFWVSRCYIGMVESTINRLHLINKPSLIILDECHMQNFNKIHSAFPDTKTLGFSATPLSASKREPMKKYYQTIICGPSIKELINLGYLSQNITRAPKTAVNSSQFQFDRLKNDFNERQMATVYGMQNNIENCLNQYFNFCLGKKTLIFNVTIEHSQKVNDCFNACGYPSRHLDSNSSSRPSKDPRCKNEREEIFRWFKETDGAILNSVMIPTMGFDEPSVQSIILNYSTLSLVKFIQTCGRGSRIMDETFIEKFHSDYPYELKIKRYFDIIDLGENWKRFGDWNDERNWEYIFRYPDEPGEGVAPVKSCPECEALIHAAMRMCPYCGHEFKKKEVKPQDIEEMILITKGIDLNALNERSEKKYKYYPFFELAVDVVNNLFLIHGKAPSQKIVDRYFKIYYDLCVQWHNRTLSGKDGEFDDISDSGWHIKKAKNNFNSLILKNNKNAPVINSDVPYNIVKYGEDYVTKQQEDNEAWEQYKKTIF